VADLNVSQLILDIGDRYADRTALIDLSGDEAIEITYAELVSRVRNLGVALRAKGLRAGDRLAIALDNGTDIVVTEWCCLLEGFVWVALNVRSTELEFADALSDCRPRAVITNARYAALLGAATDSLSCLALVVGSNTWREFLNSGEAEAERVRPGPTDAVRIRYTSGTSGRAKGAVLNRAAYDASIENVTDVIGPLDERDVVAQVAPMTHASGAMLLPHLAVGGCALLIDGFDARSLIDVCRRYRVSAMFLVPTMLVRLMVELGPEEKLPTLRTIVYGGASTPPETIAAAVERLGPVFVQIYGLTESTWPVCALRREEHARQVGEERDQWLGRLASCGRATAVGEVRVVDADGRDVDAGETGELWVRGRNTMVGYWRAGGDDDKGLDAEGWMHTGDVGVRDAQGRITIVDRLHDMIVSGGFNVYPREVEDALASHEAVLESAVVGRPSEDWGEAVHAFVVLKPQRTVTVKDLTSHLGKRLAGYKKPKTIEFVDRVPKNTSGKILRRVLREQLRANR
jgi:acyl-CoA synthetase (AMP-forming)/AMP-acid ligase II